MKFRIQTDGEKFRVQKKILFWWGKGCVNSKSARDGHAITWYRILSTRAEAQAWIDEHQEPKRKWRTL